MREIHLETWGEYLEHVQGIQEKYTLFRGQSNAAWALKTTLERYKNQEEISVCDYYLSLSRTLPTTETLTKRTWQIPSYPEFRKKIEDAPYDFGWFGKFDAYDYMIYTRHHGFPSPLLDWTSSPTIAAFFAYRDANETLSDKVAIYVYNEYINGASAIGGSSGDVKSLGSYVRSHPRHFLQQSDYTISTKVMDNILCYVPHETIISSHHIYKITLPTSLGPSVLKHLNVYNLNAHSLFNSEESLMETLAFKEFRK